MKDESKKTLMTEETKLRLKESVELRLNELTGEVNRIGKMIKDLQVAEEELKLSLAGHKNLLEYRLFIGLLNLDLCTAVLIYLRANFQYEGIYSARQIIVIISEGYKKIYNFVIKNEKGGLITKYRNDSFWIKEIGKEVLCDLSQYKPQYDLITEKLDKYLEVNFDLLKTKRDLSIHYDKNPIKVYNMMSELNIEETFKKLIPFLEILNEMFAFTYVLSQGYLQKSEIDRINIEKGIEDKAISLNQFKTKDNEAVITEFQEKILNLKTMFDKKD